MPRGWWSWATHSREGGIRGNPEAATTHLGTVTLKDSVDYLPTHSETLRPTQGRVGRVIIAKLTSEHASEMSLANNSEQQTVCRGHEELLRGAWATPSFMLPAGFLHPKTAGEHCFEINYALITFSHIIRFSKNVSLLNNLSQKRKIHKHFIEPQ